MRASGNFLAPSMVNGQAMVKSFVTLSEGAQEPKLPEGATVTTRLGNLLIVATPVDSLEQLAQLPGVKRVAVEQKVHLHNHNTRVATGQDKVNTTVDASGNLFKGKGVVVGVADGGIDFNHVNFMDADGKSRVKKACLASEIIDSKIPTVTWTEDPEEIAKMTTDLDNESHGTHTSGTAAGSYTDNGLQGMAPEADLVLCGLGNNASDANIVESVKGVFDYADSVGKPAAVNLSLGSNSDAHDGTDDFSQAMKYLVGKGHIVMISAGNEADLRMSITKTFTADSTSLSTAVVSKADPTRPYIETPLSICSFTGSPLKLQFCVVDWLQEKVVFTLPEVTLSEDGDWYLGQQKEYDDFLTYFSDYVDWTEITKTAGINVTSERVGDKCLYTINMTGVPKGSVCLAVKVTGEEGQTAWLWSSETGADSKYEFRNLVDGFVEGDNSSSINSLACNPYVICVGAYSANDSYVSYYTKEKKTDNDFPVGDIAYFSSYGVDPNGLAHPDVCAPGTVVYSSFNSHLGWLYVDSVGTVDERTYNGRTYTWGVMDGTSMATPAVTGIVATWLQANPTLTPDEVKAIIKQTATRDNYVMAGNRVQWGSGKIEAYKGLQYILTTGVKSIEVKQDNVLFYPNADGTYNLYTQGESQGVSVSVSSLSGKSAWTGRVSAYPEPATLDLGSKLPSGVYVMSVRGERVNYSTKFVVK